MRRGVLLGLIAVAVLAVVMVAAPSEAVKPVPVDYQSQIDALKAQVDALAAEVANIQLIPGPEGPPGPPGPPGPAGQGAMRVYDANRQFIGILVGITPGAMSTETYSVEPSFTVFIPTLNKFIEIQMNWPGLTDRFNLNYLYFDAPNCGVGAVYAYPANEDVVNPYYISSFEEWGDTQKFFTSTEIQTYQLRSRRASGSLTCENISSYSWSYPLTEVTLPFTFPLALPLSFE